MEIQEIMISTNFNSFSVINDISQRYGASIGDKLEHYYTNAMDSSFTESGKSLLEQSYEAYLAATDT